MVDIIVREADPEAIIPFGSRARGDAGADSDVDLPIIEREPFGPGPNRFQEAARLYRAPRRMPLSEDGDPDGAFDRPAIVAEVAALLDRVAAVLDAGGRGMRRSCPCAIWSVRPGVLARFDEYPTERSAQKAKADKIAAANAGETDPDLIRDGPQFAAKTWRALTEAGKLPAGAPARMSPAGRVPSSPGPGGDRRPASPRRARRPDLESPGNPACWRLYRDPNDNGLGAYTPGPLIVWLPGTGSNRRPSD